MRTIPHLEARAACQQEKPQNAVLGLAFEINGMLSNIEHLGMERMPYALLIYVLLVESV